MASLPFPGSNTFPLQNPDAMNNLLSMIYSIQSQRPTQHIPVKVPPSKLRVFVEFSFIMKNGTKQIISKFSESKGLLVKRSARYLDETLENQSIHSSRRQKKSHSNFNGSIYNINKPSKNQIELFSQSHVPEVDMAQAKKIFEFIENTMKIMMALDGKNLVSQVRAQLQREILAMIQRRIEEVLEDQPELECGIDGLADQVGVGVRDVCFEGYRFTDSVSLEDVACGKSECHLSAKGVLLLKMEKKELFSREMSVMMKNSRKDSLKSMRMGSKLKIKKRKVAEANGFNKPRVPEAAEVKEKKKRQRKAKKGEKNTETKGKSQKTVRKRKAKKEEKKVIEEKVMDKVENKEEQPIIKEEVVKIKEEKPVKKKVKNEATKVKKEKKKVKPKKKKEKKVDLLDSESEEEEKEEKKKEKKEKKVEKKRTKKETNTKQTPKESKSKKKSKKTHKKKEKNEVKKKPEKEQEESFEEESNASLKYDHDDSSKSRIDDDEINGNFATTLIKRNSIESR